MARDCSAKRRLVAQVVPPMLFCSPGARSRAMRAALGLFSLVVAFHFVAPPSRRHPRFCERSCSSGRPEARVPSASESKSSGDLRPLLFRGALNPPPNPLRVPKVRGNYLRKRRCDPVLAFVIPLLPYTSRRSSRESDLRRERLPAS